MPQINHTSQPRWERFERADLFDQYQQLRSQGISERQAAKALNVPRTTLQAWRLWHDSLDICPHVADFFQRGPGLAFLHRLVVAFHLVCVEVGACGIRLARLFLHLTGLDRFVAASYGAQQQVNAQIGPRSWDRPPYDFRGGLSGAGASSTASNIAANIERGF